jgi:hypothetical protein
VSCDAAACKEYDYSEDILPPRAVLEQVRAHDERMRKLRPEMAEAKACYQTEWWSSRRGTKDEDATQVEIEVNRIRGAINAYLAALYPRANRVVLTADPAGKGDPIKTQVALNRWLAGQRIHGKVLTALRQGLIFPGCGFKVGYYAGRGNPLDRVWMRVVPWWELLLDADAGDAEDERFRGHLFYRPLREVRREYGLPKLRGAKRRDYLSESDTDDRTPSNGDRPDTDEHGFVRMLELCNLRDTYRDPATGVEFLGRLEIYALDQGDDSKHPIWMGPLPFSGGNGEPTPHIEPLIFNCEPEFPLKGISGVKHLMPQQREINVYRTFMANSSRKDTRQYVARASAFPADHLTKLSAGIDGLILLTSADYQGPLSDLVHLIPTGPISGNALSYMAQAEADFNRGLGASPNARGEITKATAFEVQTTQLYTESEFGLHGSIKDDVLARVVGLALRALIAAMQDGGDSTGGYDHVEPKLAPVGAKPETGGGTDERAEAVADAAAEVSAGPRPMTGGDETGEVEVKPKRAKVKQQVLTLRERSEVLTVTVQDLDAQFEISFVEGGRTPITDAAMQQNLVALLEPYRAAWETAQKGGPQAVFARAWMQSVADRFDLPKDLHPDELYARLNEEQSSREKEPEDGPAAEAMAPAAPTPDPGMADRLAKIAALPPTEALGVLRTLLEADPAAVQAIDEALTQPPEVQAQVVAAMLQQLAPAQPTQPGMDPALSAMGA